jgi:hypothetical protein
MTKEVVRGHESGKPFMPVLRDIPHDEFQRRQPEWHEAMGAAASIRIPPEGVPAVGPRVIDGLKALGIHPKSQEERDAEARAKERAQKLGAILVLANQTTDAQDWDAAALALNEYLSLAPEDAAVQGRLVEVQRRQQENRLKTLRTRAESLAKAEKWDEAFSAWREYLALEPEDREAAQAELQRVEKLKGLVETYAKAQVALKEKNYDRAIELLKGIVLQDEAYKHASRLLSKAIEARRRGERSVPGRWLWGGVAVVGLLALVLLLTRLLSFPTPHGPTATPPPIALLTNTITPSPTLAGTSVALGAGQATPTRSPEPASRINTPTRPLQPAPKAATPTHTPEPTPQTATATRSLEPTSVMTPKQPTAPPTVSPAVTGVSTSQFVMVPDKLVGQFFAPGPSTAALAMAGDTLWVADGSQRMLYQLDRTGTPLTAFPITFTNSIRSLTWDGEALCLTLYSASSADPNDLVVRLDPAGKVLESFRQPASTGWLQARNSTDGTVWEYRDEFLVQFSADGSLVRTYRAPIQAYRVARLTWARHELWIVDFQCYWWHFSPAGNRWDGGRQLPVVFSSCSTQIVFDDDGYLWLAGPGDRKIYQLSLRQEPLPPTSTPRPTPTRRKGEVLELPRPQFKQAAVADKAIAHVTNNLQGVMVLEFGKPVIVNPGDTWSAELEEGAYTIFASANAPEPIAFSGRELLLKGYEYTWVLSRPE